MGGFKDKATEQSYYQKNKERIKAKSRETAKKCKADPLCWSQRLERSRKLSHRADQVIKRKQKHWRRTYDLTPEAYASLLAKQGGVCAICKCNRPKGCSMKGGDLYVDHDHVTGTVRGLLCTTCNAHLSTFESHKAEMEAYLNSH